jgi:hypothetical protein
MTKIYKTKTHIFLIKDELHSFWLGEYAIIKASGIYSKVSCITGFGAIELFGTVSSHRDEDLYKIVDGFKISERNFDYLEHLSTMTEEEFENLKNDIK